MKFRAIHNPIMRIKSCIAFLFAYAGQLFFKLSDVFAFEANKNPPLFRETDLYLL